MAKREDLERELLESVRRGCAETAYGASAAEMAAQVDVLLRDGWKPTVQRDVPWLTDVFLRGILDGESAQDEARRNLLSAWRELPGAVGSPASPSLSSSVSCPAPSQEDPVVEGDRSLRMLPEPERGEAALAFRNRLEALSGQPNKTGALAHAWLGRHGPLPLLPFRAWSDAELLALAKRMTSEESALKENGTRLFPLACAEQANTLSKRYAALSSARRAEAARRLSWLPEGSSEAIAKEIDSLELLFRMIVSATYGMNRRGVGNIPALHVEGRRTRDGGTVGIGADEIDGANAVLDSLAMEAFLWFAGTKEVDGSHVCDFGPVRRYVEGPANARYLIGMIQDAVAGRRGHELAVDPAAAPVKAYADAPVHTEGSADETRTLADTFTAEEGDDEERDRARFFRKVLGKLAPELMRYFQLVRGGMSKGEALKAVGAKSAHFVEREAKALLKELSTLNGPDFADLAGLVKDLLKGA